MGFRSLTPPWFPAFAGKTELCIGLGSPRMPRTPIRGSPAERAGARVLFLNHSLIPAVIEVTQPIALETGDYGAP